jgi:hypothetical protein
VGRGSAFCWLPDDSNGFQADLHVHTHTPRTYFDADKKKAYIMERESDLSKGVGIEIQSGLSKWYVKKPLNRTSGGSPNVNNTPRRCVGRWI